MKDSPTIYKIRVRGILDPAWSVWFEGLEIALDADCEPPETVLSGLVRDQSTLRGIMNRLWDLNLELIGISRSVISQ